MTLLFENTRTLASNSTKHGILSEENILNVFPIYVCVDLDIGPEVMVLKK